MKKKYKCGICGNPCSRPSSVCKDCIDAHDWASTNIRIDALEELNNFELKEEVSLAEVARRRKREEARFYYEQRAKRIQSIIDRRTTE